MWWYQYSCSVNVMVSIKTTASAWCCMEMLGYVNVFPIKLCKGVFKVTYKWIPYTDIYRHTYKYTVMNDLLQFAASWVILAMHVFTRSVTVNPIMPSYELPTKVCMTGILCIVHHVGVYSRYQRRPWNKSRQGTVSATCTRECSVPSMWRDQCRSIRRYEKCPHPPSVFLPAFMYIFLIYFIYPYNYIYIHPHTCQHPQHIPPVLLYFSSPILFHFLPSSVFLSFSPLFSVLRFFALHITRMHVHASFNRTYVTYLRNLT